MNLLEFANPIAWWAALLALPIVVLYILKTRMRRQQVSTLLFWDRIFDESRPRAWWQHLRQLLSLLVQLAILLFLVSALVDPLWSWQQRQQRRIVLVFDNSASMQAIEPGETTRLELAREAARALVRSLRGSDQMAILTAGSTPQVAIGMTDHQNSLFKAIDAVPATDGPTAVLPAVTVAERMLADFEGESEILVLTDGCTAAAEQLASRERVKLYGVGSELDNVGITRYQVRRSLTDSIGYQVLVDITSFSEQEVEVRLKLELDGQLVDVLPLTIPPGETVTRVVEHTSPMGGELTATLDASDALPADNRALALLPRRDPIPVVLATEGNLFLESVLESIPLVQLRVVSEPPAAAPKGGVLVLDRKMPASLPAGRVLAIDPQGESDLWKISGPIDEPIVATVDSDSPLTRHVRLTNVLFPEARRLEFTGEAQPLIRDPLEQPLLARLSRRGGDVVVLTGSLEQGDLPLRIAFPVLMKNAIEWFRGTEGDLQPATPSGEMVRVSLVPLLQQEATEEATSQSAATPGPASSDEPASSAAIDMAVVETAEAKTTRSFTLLSPSGQEIPLATPEPQATVGPLLETGLWQIRPVESSTDPNNSESAAASESSSVAIACNLVNRQESDLRPRVPLEPLGDSTLLAFGGHPLWFYLTLGGLGLLVTEWWLYQRRIVE
jgi:hypothetical protein